MVKVGVSNRELKCLYTGDGTRVVRAYIDRMASYAWTVGRKDGVEDESENMADNVGD